MPESPVSAWNASHSFGPPPVSPFERRPAGLWIRLAALWVDGLVLLVLHLPVLVLLGVVGWLGGPFALDEAKRAPPGYLPVALLWLGSLLFIWLYFALFEASFRQATPGKRALGLSVTDLQGERISFARASGRFFARTLSALPFHLGYLAAAFTPKKRALHDYLAGTLVERNRPVGRTATLAVGATLLLLLFGLIWAGVESFISERLRLEADEGPSELRGLAKAEAQHLAQNSSYLDVAVPQAGKPGPNKLDWDADDLAQAHELRWEIVPPTFFTYRVEVAEADDGLEAYSACAESDLDGDGRVAAWVLFQTVVDEDGEVELEPPDAPCSFDPVTTRPLSFQPGDPIGVPLKVSPDDVY